MPVSFFCSAEACEAVFRDQLPEIVLRMEAEKRTGLHLVVVDPGLTPEQVEYHVRLGEWVKVLIWERSVGNVPEGSAYITNARNKAVEAHFHKETLSGVWGILSGYTSSRSRCMVRRSLPPRNSRRRLRSERRG